MSREMIRTMKRVVANGRDNNASTESVSLAKDAALRLLARSISFGHGRLSVVRLAMAVRSGADVPQEHWIYCRQVASSSEDACTQALFEEAVQAVPGSSKSDHQAH
ncbi:MAG: hypothetical protein P4L96_09895 [Rhodoferax sp.]|nr:hypothetical protein [Rhodoferax sp.]